MKSVSLVLKIWNDNGTLKFLPARKEDTEARDNYLVSFAGRHGTVFIRAQYTEVTEEYVAFSLRRWHYFAYFGKMVAKGYEPWTSQIPGKNKSEKVEALHTQYKKMFQKVKGRKGALSISDEKVGDGKKKKTTYQQAVEYMCWAMDELEEFHEKMTQKATGSGWTFPPWRSK